MPDYTISYDVTRKDVMQANTMLAFSIVSLTLSWICLGLRLWVRTSFVKNFGWDDATMILSCLLLTGFNSVVFLIVRFGWRFPPKDDNEARTLLLYIVSAQLMYVVTIIALKISLGLFMKRITTKNWQNYVIYSVIAVTCLSGGMSIGFGILRCGNPNNFNGSNLERQCWGGTEAILAFAYQQGTVTTLTDLILTILPVSILRKSKMDLKSKIYLGIILLLGCLGSLASIVRFRYISGLAITNDLGLYLRNSGNVSIWTIIEVGTAAVAGSLGTLRPLMRTAHERLAGTTLSNISGFWQPSTKSNHQGVLGSSKIAFAKGNGELESRSYSLQSSGRSTPTDAQKSMEMHTYSNSSMPNHNSNTEHRPIISTHNTQQYPRSYVKPDLNKSLPQPAPAFNTRHFS